VCRYGKLGPPQGFTGSRRIILFNRRYALPMSLRIDTIVLRDVLRYVLGSYVLRFDVADRRMVNPGRLSFGEAYLYVETTALFTRRLK
jgi:hypothetical protein